MTTSCTEHQAPLVLSGGLDHRAEELISNIRPSPESVERRHGVQDYVRQLIARCFHPEQVIQETEGVGGIVVGEAEDAILCISSPSGAGCVRCK